MIVLVLFAYGAVMMWQIRSLTKQREWRELVAFVLLMSLALAGSILYCLDVPLPNPAKAINKLLEWLGLHY